MKCYVTNRIYIMHIFGQTEYIYNMNKTRYYVIIYVCAILSLFILPNIFVKGDIFLDTEQQANKENIEGIYNFAENTNVKVLMKETNEVVDMGLEEYIKGVVSAEMPASYELEALKAQAVVARTYTLNKIMEHKKSGNTVHPNADICSDSTHCQAYLDSDTRIKKWNDKGEDGLQLWDRIEEAVISTNGIIITYNQEPIKAFFHANSGGKTENVELVWSGEAIDYLQSVETVGENNYNQYSSNVMLTKEELNSIMKNKYPTCKIDFKKDDYILIQNRSESGRVQNLQIGNITMSGTDARKIFGLKSTNFEISINAQGVEFIVLGYGHGVGMSQTGANELAKGGYNYEQIIHHYYTNVEIINME